MFLLGIRRLGLGGNAGGGTLLRRWWDLLRECILGC